MNACDHSPAYSYNATGLGYPVPCPWCAMNKAEALTRTVAELRDEIRQLGSVVLAQEQRNNELRAALQRIAKWEGEFPLTGDRWADGSPVSYGAQYGTHGERDYMRGIATAALASPPAEEEPK